MACMNGSPGAFGARRPGPRRGDSRCKKLFKTVELIITQDLVYQEGHTLEFKHGRFRKTAHAFPTQTEALQWGQVVDTILVEINARGHPEPATLMPIATLVHDFLAATERTDLVGLFELAPVDSLVAICSLRAQGRSSRGADRLVIRQVSAWFRVARIPD